MSHFNLLLRASRGEMVPLALGQGWYAHRRSLLFPDDFDEETFVTLAVKFTIEDLLPGSRIEAPVRKRDDHLVVQQQIFEMGIAVVFACTVMVIVRVFGGDLLYPLHDVLPKARFVVIDNHGGSDMHSGNKREPFLDTALVDNALHLIGDRHKFFR
jgi:hypothetical protein